MSPGKSAPLADHAAGQTPWSEGVIRPVNWIRNLMDLEILYSGTALYLPVRDITVCQMLQWTLLLGALCLCLCACEPPAANHKFWWNWWATFAAAIGTVLEVFAAILASVL